MKQVRPSRRINIETVALNPERRRIRIMPLLLGVLASSIAVFAAFGQSNPEQANLQKEQPANSLHAATSPVPAPPSKSVSSLTKSAKSIHADNFYRTVWGVEKMEVREAASGVLLRFSYRVANADKAQVLNDKKSTPYLIDEKTGAVLQIPTMPKVGMLRQTGTPVNGLEYWMVFSNKGNFVKPGNRVSIVIGNFRAQGLVVQ
jgi:hypothetical protein